jgi:hypothetical protein
MDGNDYKNVSDFFEKENRRIASRISWLFATQTIIFGAFEYVNEHANKLDPQFSERFLLAIAQIGFSTSVLFAISIFAAAINYMYIYYPASKVTTDVAHPNLKGGFQWILIPLGFVGAVGLPIVFSYIWLNFCINTS